MEKPIITSDDLVEFDLDAYPIWTCTNRLRWDRSEVKITRQGFGIWHELQQLWECSNGNTEWRNVEIAD